MKIDRTKLKKSSSEVPADCKALIEKLKACGNSDALLAELKHIKVWTFGKCELFHWVDVLDICDEVLDKACKRAEGQWTLPCDLPENQQDKDLLLQVLQFTALLIEHSFTRHLYNSMEHLTTLLASSDMTVILGVLNLLYVFSKRSNFITRLNIEKKQGLVARLTHLAESWGGKENGFGLAECCQDLPMSAYPASATTLHFEFYAESKDEKSGKKNSANVLSSIHIENVDKISTLPSELMDKILSSYNVPEDKKMLLFTHIRLAHSFSRYDQRVKCVQARLQAISIMVYSNAIQENVNTLLYSGLIEELVDILEVKDMKLLEIKAAALRTLTSIIHLERTPRLHNIIDATGASSYHGFLPVLVRSCIQHMTDAELEPFPQPFATALFSFLYHLASYESGGEALVACGMMESLLKVINWYGDGQEHITFVTRAVRVIDLITNLDMAAFQSHGGLSTFINRLEHEVDICRKEQPFMIRPARSDSIMSMEGNPASPSSSHADGGVVAMETDSILSAQASDSGSSDAHQGASTSAATPVAEPQTPVIAELQVTLLPETKNIQCFPQRAALLKSMLNFLKKAIPDPAFSESIRHLMDGSLPRSLKHVISNAEYYGPSLFLLATDVVTVYVFQEPSLLSSLQDNGLTDVVLQALLVKDVPATREVLASLPNVFSALCLNARGLQAFVQCKPFDRLFKVLLSPGYLSAMRRRRSSDPLGDTASNLGNAMDELMRHQPSLRTDATKATIQLLEEVCAMGRDSRFFCQKPQPKTEQPASVTLRSSHGNEATSSDDEDEEDEVVSNLSKQPDSAAGTPQGQPDQPQSSSSVQERTAIPLMDYVLNVMKFVEAILSNNTTDDHCREFVNQKGLIPLMGILGLPNLPVDFPASPSCQAVASVCKSILTLSHEPQVLKQGLLHLNEVLQSLEPLHKFLDPPGGSVLLRELASAPINGDPTLSAQATPLLHALSATHAYITMFTHVCKVGQSDIRSISVSHWGSELGLQVLKGLSKLYTSLVWESTVLLAFCSEDILPPDCEFGKADLEKLVPKELKLGKDKTGKPEEESSLMRSAGEMGSNGVSAAMESLSTSEDPSVPMETEDSSGATDLDNKKGKLSPAMQAQIKQIKPLLSASSRLGRALAELFGLLVKLCVGSPVRQRRSQLPPTPTVPTPAARAVASALTKLLANGLSWTPPPASPVPKLRLTFFICSVGFTSPMLFDEKKNPYHLMLQKFLCCGGQDALFESFKWALSCGGKTPLEEGLEHPDLPDGTGEFLDAWLMLVEKMVNTKNVLESPHILPTASTQPGFVPFDPLQYLISTHKAAFHGVMYLWNKKPLKVYGGRMSESILAILCHVIKGEAVIREKLNKEKEEKNPKGGSSTPAGATTPAGASGIQPPRTPQEPEINQEHLQQLMDMGFTREHCMEALLHTTSLEQATEYILTHPPPLPQPPQAAPPVVTEDKEKKEAEAESEQEKQVTQEPLESEVIDHFTENMMQGCMQLLDTLPETVYRVCDLIVVITNRNGDKWRDTILAALVGEIAELSVNLMEAAAPLTTSDSKSMLDWANQLSTMPEAPKLAVRLHLLSLLFEEMKIPSAQAVEDLNILDLLVRLLDVAQQCLSTVKEASTPKWVAPLLLLLDLYEKVSVASKRKSVLNTLLGKSRLWKWFDDRSGRWCNYSVSNNKTIDDAYQAGEQSVRFTAGRRRYTVQFSSMVQINEETGNRRPIMLSLPGKEEKPKNNKDETEKNKDTPSPTEEKLSKPEKVEDKMETEEGKEQEIIRVLRGLTPDNVSTIIRCSVSLIGIPVDPDTLHAMLRLSLRLTREHQFALQFAEQGGPKLLLSLTQVSAFQGFTSLATLILRHIMEEPDTMRHTLEKVIRSACQGGGSSLSGVAQGSIGAKELHYILRVLGPAACRCPEVFTEIAKKSLRIALPPPSKRDEDEARLTGPNTPQLLKCLPTKQSTSPPTEGVIKGVVVELLNALIVKYSWKQEDNKLGTLTGTLDIRQATTLGDALQEVVNEISRDLVERQQMVRQDSSADLQQDEEAAQGQSAVVPGGSDENKTSGEAGTADAQATAKKVAEEDDKKKRPLLPKSAVMRLLAELVRSYAGCAHLVSQHVYHAGQSELVTEDCNVLAFILDNLLPQCQDAGDKDCPALARVLIAALSACNHSTDAQTTLVGEIKGSLQRALGLLESTEKHAKIQALTSIISTVIEACPSPGQIPNQVFKGQQNTMNNMVKIMLKKGLVTDLARIPHSLDLSSPQMANTINSALKPLETLSRIVNQPQPLMSKHKNKPTSVTPLAQSSSTAIVDETTAEGVTAGSTPGEDATTQEQPAAGEGRVGENGEVTIEDVTENRDHHDLEEAEPLEEVEPEMDSQAQISDVEEVLDELLQRNTGNNAENEVLGEILASRGGYENLQEDSQVDDTHDDVIIDVEVETEEEDMTHHDSQMVSQMSDDEDHHHDDNVVEDESASEADDDEEDEDHDEDDEGPEDADEEEDDEEDEDDDDEDEDDDGSDMEAADNFNEFTDEPLYRLNDDNDLYVHLEDMLPTGAPQVLFEDRGQIRTYQLPISNHDQDNGNGPAGPSVPPAPSNVTSSHPLLVRHAEPHAAGGSLSARVHRTGRQRGTYRYNPSTQTLHVHYNAAANRHPNPPAILQRLLGPSAAADVLQLTNTLSATNQARFHLDSIRFVSRPEEDPFEDLFHESFSEGAGSGSGVLSSVPSALCRWTEEARVLDGDSMHDCVTALKPEIIGELEKYRESELAERREKRKKLAEEEAAKKEKEKKEKENREMQEEVENLSTEARQEGTPGEARSGQPASQDHNQTIEWGTPAGSMDIGDRALGSMSPGPLSSTTGLVSSSADNIVPESSIAETLMSEASAIPTATPAQSQASTLASVENIATAVAETVLATPAMPPEASVMTTQPPGAFMIPQASQMVTPANSVPLVTPSAPLAPRQGDGFFLPTPPWPYSTPGDPLPPLPDTTPPSESMPSELPMETSPEAMMSQEASSTGAPPGEGALDCSLISASSQDDTITEASALQATQMLGLHLVGNSIQPPLSSTVPSSGDGIITPEEPSNITSSDAVTINSSGSGGSEPPSTASSGTPSGEQPANIAEVTTTTASDTSSTAQPPAQATAGPSSGGGADTGGEDNSLPEGVDPSFLAALPDNIRQEVIAEQLRLQRIQQRAQQQQQQAQALGVAEVNPEFLAALPPNIQEEVLAQQRAEQARIAAEQGQSEGTPAPADTTVDPAGFISSLPTSLRQQVLADMDDSMVAVLPSDLAAEAQSLRRELEERHRRLMQERLFAQGAASLSAILRQSGLAGRLGTARYAIRNPPRSGQWGWNSGRAGQGLSQANTVRLRGRHLLDHEALTCLLVLLFVDEPKLNTSRLHRVLRNLCYHAQTRTWVIRSLLAILQRTSDCKSEPDDRGGSGKSTEKLKRKSSLPMSDGSTPGKATAEGKAGTMGQQASWLSVSLDAALGCRTNVFQVHKSGKKHLSPANTFVTIHPQASPLICRHVLDTLISLAKSFPCQFLPQNKAKEAAKCEIVEGKDSEDKLKSKEPMDSNKSSSNQTSPAKAGKPEKSDSVTSRDSTSSLSKPETDFWDLLVRLDSVSGSKKGKSIQRLHSSNSSEVEGVANTFECSPLGQLMTLLAHPVVRRSQLLTDRLLRLLGLVSVGLRDITQQQQQQQQASASTTTTGATTTTTTTTISTPVIPAPVSTLTTSATTITSTVSVVSAGQTIPPSQPTSEAETTRQEESQALNETMDVSHVPDDLLTSTPLPGKKEEAKQEKDKEQEAEEEKEEMAVLENQLQLAVEVLTSKSCSEEGLEDATNLLLQLSRANNATRDTVLRLLLGGARQLGLTVCDHIRELLKELTVMVTAVREGSQEEESTDDTNLPPSSQPKGVLMDRFQGNSVVVHAPSKIKTSGRELQLPSMSLLTNKNSSQQFLLRILKVIIQLREAARLAAKKTRRQDQLLNIPEALAILEAEAEAMMEMVSHTQPEPAAEQGQGQAGQGQAEGQSQDQPATERQESQETTSAESSSTRPSVSDRDMPMDIDQPGPSSTSSVDSKALEKKDESLVLPRLSEQLQLEELWETLGECLSELARTSDHHAVLVLQPAVEAFFIVHAGEKENQKKEQPQQRREDQLAHLNIDISDPASPAPSSSRVEHQQAGSLVREDSVMSVASVTSTLPPDTQKFLKFAETHHTVLNQILRQSTTPLADGPFSVLVDHTRVLDFDVKRRYFRQELDRMDEGLRKEDLAVHVRREHVFEDSFRELHRRTIDEWKHRFYIVFEGEEGQDAGGLLREWYLIISREIFNPMYALFCTSPGDRVTYTINPSSHCNSNHLSYFKFVGRIIAKAIYDNKLLECYFTRSFYKHILGVLVRYIDMESEDYSFYQGLVFLLENDVTDLGYELTFSTEIQEFGVTEVRDLRPNGRNIPVTEENKRDYVKLVCQMKMTGAIRKQLNAFLEGFYDIIPKRLISIFNEQELELLISGLPTIDIDDLKANAEYHKYQANSLQIQWFWRALRSFEPSDRACFLQFVTGTSKVPLQGFAHLEGMNGTQKFQIHRDDRSTDRLPCAHTCFNQLDLPAYETYDKLRTMLLRAVKECSEGFGLA